MGVLNVNLFVKIVYFLMSVSFCFFGMATLQAQSQPPNGMGGLQPVLTITPREVNLGTLGPGEETRGVFYIKNIGQGTLPWSAEGPDGWVPTEYQKLAGMVGSNPEPFKIQLAFENENGSGKIQGGSLLLRLEGGGQTAVFRREYSIGIIRDSIRFHFPGGTRTVLFQVRLSELASAALLDVEPIRVDLGVVRSGDEITQRVHVTNRGRETLKWNAGTAGMKGMPATASVPAGRYVSFRREAAAGTGHYPSNVSPGEGIELYGPWSEEGGYPVCQGDQSSLRYRFTGTGISLLVWRTPERGALNVLIDEKPFTLIDGFADHKEKAEILVAENLPNVPHLLTVVNGGGRIILEGVRVFGKPIIRGPRGWINVFPDSGMTTRETDYVTIAIHTRQMMPGIYAERVYFTSNGGEADIELLVEIAPETQPRFLDVFRYLSGSDYLYTANPLGEASRLQMKGFKNLGIVFRLFNSGTAGTTEFFRWFNPVLGDHYYSSDPAGGGKVLKGYLFEGSIGNIATFRLSGTKELYRWYNPSTGRHFYTTDQGGEGLGKKGYRYDGIAGYVR
jgi:hypothetical protein